MKKIISIGLLCIYSIVIVHAQCTPLETLWKLCETYNEDVQTLEKNLQEVVVQNDYRWTMYKPSVAVSSNLSYSDSWEELVSKPASMNASLSLNKSLPGSFSIGTDISYGLTRTLYDPLEDITTENLSYNHSASLSLNASQSLRPFWLQGEKRDPLFSQYALSVLQAHENKELQQKQIIQSITSCFIQMRILSRNIIAYDALLSLSNKKICAYKELVEKGQIDIVSVWQEEESKQNYTKESISLEKEYNEQKRQLLLLSGNTIDASGILEKQLLQTLPSVTTKNDTIEIQKTLLTMESEYNRLQQILVKQYNAPTLKISSGVSVNPEKNEKDQTFEKMWSEEKNWNWNFTIALDLSSMFNSELSKESKLNDIKQESLIMEKEQIDEQIKLQKNYYNAMINTLQESEELTKKLSDNWKNKYNDYLTLYESGGCTLLDVEMCKVQSLMKTQELGNIEDQSWYYQWLLCQF